MKLSELTADQVSKAAARVRSETRQAMNAAFRGDRAEAYAAAERAQQAAFDLKELFSLSPEEMEATK